MTFIATIVSYLVKLGLGGVIDKTIALMERKAELENDKEAQRSAVAIEHLKATVEETRIIAELNKSKMTNLFFWVFCSLFIFPLGFWWTAVIIDSVFHLGWQVANLPTQEMRDWAGSMIKWLFYSGSVGVALKLLK
ncbi:hypothetical protein [uncultured Cohaesibacter sp.]|uniref:hypothetical protein n=1 Tax=uncultured Cohaesibacter sp. TaxID=1002546 RepID=UPI0029C816E7|nr:hypothetical protein [uncultured Cohaesibacter sp.]